MSAENTKQGMSLIVRTVTHWLTGFIILFGIYVVLSGHVSPGGGFAGGVIIACAFMLLTLAEGKARASRILNNRTAATLAGLGALLFLGTGLAGMFFGNSFFNNFIVHPTGIAACLLSGGIIGICEIAIGIIVSMSLFMVFSALSGFHVEPADEAGSTAEEGRNQ